MWELVDIRNSDIVAQMCSIQFSLLNILPLNYTTLYSSFCNYLILLLKNFIFSDPLFFYCLGKMFRPMYQVNVDNLILNILKLILNILAFMMYVS